MKYITKTGSGRRVEAKNGMIYLDGKIIGNGIQYPPEWVLKKCPECAGIVLYNKKNIVTLTTSDIEKIKSTRIKVPEFSKYAKNRLAEAERNEDINFLNSDLTAEPTFSDATDGQYEIYTD